MDMEEEREGHESAEEERERESTRCILQNFKKVLGSFENNVRMTMHIFHFSTGLINA